VKIFDESKIKINLPKLIDSRMLICANSGGGKSYTIRKILETAGSDVMSIVLDVEGEFKTLREKYDYLLIGQPGDVPVNIKSAPLLPRKLMELNVSTIIDLSDLKLHERIMYVKKFLDALMELPKKLWQPCLVIVDEAHMYAGQREKQESTRSIIDLMTRGRKRGYCGILATQRIAKLHKDAAAEANNYMVGRTGLDVDMKRASEILGFTSKQDMLSLRNLEAGEFYVFGPAITKGVEKVKVAKVKTTHPKVGMDLRSKISPPTEKIKAMLSKLNDLPQEAEQKAKTIKELKQQVRELKWELKKKPTLAIDERQLKFAEQRGFAKAEKELSLQLQEHIKKTINDIKKIAAIANSYTSMPKKIIPAKITKIKTSLPMKKSKPINRPIISYEEDIKLNLCERRICSALYNHQDLSPFSKKRLGVFTEYAHKSGGFNNALAHLNSLNLIRRRGGQIELTVEGIQQIPNLLNSDLSLCERVDISNWQNKLSKCERTIFKFLLDNPEQEFTKQEIGENTEPSYAFNSGGFNNALSKLNSLALISRSGGHIKFNEELLEL